MLVKILDDIYKKDDFQNCNSENKFGRFLLEYLFKAMKPKMYFEINNFLSREIYDIIHKGSYNYDISMQKDKLYDVIIEKEFNFDKYNNSLNYDGLYITETCEMVNNFEYFIFDNLFIIKKSDYIPFWLLKNTDKYKNPIIYRN